MNVTTTAFSLELVRAIDGVVEMSQVEHLPSKHWAHGIPVVLAALLIFSGAFKAHQLATEPVAETSMLTSRWFLLLIIHCEWILAAWLLAGIYRRVAWWSTLVAFSVFATVALTHVIRGDTSCGCFGSLHVSPWVSLAVDVMAIVALAVGRGILTVDTGGGRIRVASAVGVLCSLMIPSTWAIASFEPSIVDSAGVMVGADRMVVLEPSAWMGEKFRLGGYIFEGERLLSGEWEVWLHKSDCRKCNEKLRSFTPGKSSSPSVAIVDVSPKTSRRDMGQYRELEIEYFALSNAYEWFVETPATVRISQGVVIGVE